MELFAERGYAGASLDEVAARARVTKGALYHHFAGKQALFLAAFDQVEREVVQRVAATLTARATPWESAMHGLRSYLDICLEPSYQRIVMRDAPAVLGLAEWRSCEERYTLGIIRDVLAALIKSGDVEPLPLDALTAIVFSALGSGAELIAASDDPESAGREVGGVIERLLAGLRPGAVPG